MKNCYCRIQPLAFALAAGFVWAAILFIMAMIVTWFNYGHGFVQGVSSLYYDYRPGLVGGIIGAFWGFIDAFIGSLVFVWIYNLILGKNYCQNKNSDPML